MTVECGEKVLMALIPTRAVFSHQGNATIRSVWGRLHTGSSPAIRTIEQPRELPFSRGCIVLQSGSGLLPVKYAFAVAVEWGGGKPNAMLAYCLLTEIRKSGKFRFAEIGLNINVVCVKI